MKTKLIWPLSLCIIMLPFLGCATRGDLEKTNRELTQKLVITAEKVANLDQKLSALKTENDNIHTDFVKKSDDAITSLRKNQAENGADITSIKDQLQQLRGLLEALRKDFSLAVAKSNQRDEENREKINSVSFKVNFIENFLDLGKEGSDKNDRQNSLSKDNVKGKSDKETHYAEAYETFKEGKYEKARAEFQNFLKMFPNTEYSDNAQFWIGECYYYEKKYEKAILEYEKVVKNYPDGNRAPYALLKQGLSFLILGDKASAKLILQQVMKDYPNTNQARIARAKLLEIK